MDSFARISESANSGSRNSAGDKSSLKRGNQNEATSDRPRQKQKTSEMAGGAMTASPGNLPPPPPRKRYVPLSDVHKDLSVFEAGEIALNNFKEAFPEQGLDPVYYMVSQLTETLGHNNNSWLDKVESLERQLAVEREKRLSAEKTAAQVADLSKAQLVLVKTLEEKETIISQYREKERRQLQPEDLHRIATYCAKKGLTSAMVMAGVGSMCARASEMNIHEKIPPFVDEFVPEERREEAKARFYYPEAKRQLNADFEKLVLEDVPRLPFLERIKNEKRILTPEEVRLINDGIYDQFQELSLESSTIEPQANQNPPASNLAAHNLVSQEGPEMTVPVVNPTANPPPVNEIVGNPPPEITEADQNRIGSENNV